MHRDHLQTMDSTRRNLLGGGVALAAGSLIGTGSARAQALQKITIAYRDDSSIGCRAALSSIK